ncbi:nucleolar protein 16 [Stigmatopora nigra]
MPKAKGKKKMTFNYNKDRKKLKRKMLKKANPRIENKQIREAWNSRKSVAMNMRDMGLAYDPNVSVSIKKDGLVGFNGRKHIGSIVTKPYVIKQMEEEANLPRKSTASLSADIVQYVQHMIREHKEDYKAMAHDEKNYYQDTPKQIRKKIMYFKQLYPEKYNECMVPLADPAS